MAFPKLPTNNFTLRYMTGTVIFWTFYWFIGEDLTSLLFFIGTVLLWVTTYFPMPKTQQILLRGACSLRILTGGETATRVPAMLIEAATILAMAAWFHFIGWSMVPIVFLIGQTLMVNFVIERVIAEDKYAQLIRANFNA